MIVYARYEDFRLQQLLYFFFRNLDPRRSDWRTNECVDSERAHAVYRHLVIFQIALPRRRKRNSHCKDKVIEVFFFQNL